VTLLITDRKDAFARVRAKREEIKERFIDPAAFASSEKYEDRLGKILERERIDIIALAGYMRILGKEFVRHFKHRIINIHPALLPSFRGAHAIADAWRAKVKETGATVHFVDEKVDHGPVILQERLKIRSKDSLKTLEVKIHRLEHRVYPRALRQVILRYSRED
jgi:phosphoribosylglycinamide formyltransferase-1